MLRQFRAEITKARSGYALALLLVVASILDALSVLGNGSKASDQLANGTATVASLSHNLIQLGFGSLLFATLFGSIMVTGEYRSGAISRSILLADRRIDVFGAKAAVSVSTGLTFGVCGTATSWLVAALSMKHIGQTLVIDRETWLISAGIVLVCALAGPWGTFIGWLVRNQVAAVVFIVVWTLIAEGALEALLPGAGRFLPGGAQAAIYRDTTTSHILSMPLGVAVFFGWLAVVGVVAARLLDRRDLT